MTRHWPWFSIVTLAAPLVAAAQTSQPVAPLPTIPFADYSFGFEMRVPADWVYDRTRFAGPDGAVGLLRGNGASTADWLQVLVFRTPEAADFPDWLKRFEGKLSSISGTQRIERREHKLASRSVGELAVDATRATVATRTHYLCIPFDAGTVWVFSIAGPTSDAAASERRLQYFNQIAGSVRILLDPEQARRITAAFERGQKLRERLPDAVNSLNLAEGTAYYELSVGGKPVGYFARETTRETRSLVDPRSDRNTKEGLHVRERGWRFDDDGSAQETRSDLFASFDGQSELIETRFTQVAAPTALVRQNVITLDQCVREENVLFSSYSTNLDVSLPDPRPPIRVEATYLSLAWVRVLPALLGTQPGELHAFAVYDSQVRALVTYTIQAMGPRQAPQKSAGPTFAFETREGFSADPTVLFTNAAGEPLCLEGGEVRLLLSSEREIDARYGPRREAAKSRLGPKRP